MRKKQLLFLLLLVSLCLSLNFVALANTSNADTIVYVTDTGDKYHVRSCHYLRSVNEFTLEQAVADGKTPCSYCNPPLPNFILAQTPNNSNAQADVSTNTNSNSFNWSPVIFAVIVFVLLPISLYIVHICRYIKDTPPKTAHVKAQVCILNKDEFAFVNGRRYARISLQATTLQFNRYFNTTFTMHEIKDAYYNTLGMYYCNNQELSLEALDMIQMMLSFNQPWQDIAAWVNQTFYMSCGPSELRNKYLKASTSTLPSGSQSRR
ncbi:MAG: hypothetical protein IJ017_04405 [Oscillospiraceae bacterium]|nr:hypothetical protein [Oscillospiraceae bacterium]